MPRLPSSSGLLLAITAISVLLTTPTAAQDITPGIQNPLPFNLVESTQQPLLDLLSSKLEIVSLQDVLSTATVKTEPIDPSPFLNVLNGFRWSGGGSGGNDDAEDDLSTDLWEPRGLARGEDRLDVETWEKDDRGGDHDEDLDEVLVVSWADVSNSASSRNKGVRVSFVNAPEEDEGQERTYIHVLLVEAVETGDGDDGDGDGGGKISFQALKNVHAGGLVWHGNWLYVSDTTSVAIRVFDLNNILKVKKGKGIGLVDGGAYEAYNHSYVIPQARSYKLSLPSDIIFDCSYIALDRNSTRDGTVSLLAGESKADENVHIARWKIDPKTFLPLITSESDSTPPIRKATAEWAYVINISRITGFASRGRNWFIASLYTTERTLGELNVWRPKLLSESAAVFPEQVGGVVYRKKGDQILALNKEAGGRGIWPLSALKLYQEWAEVSIAAGHPIPLDEDPDGLEGSSMDSTPEPPGDSENGTTSAVPTDPSATSTEPAMSPTEVPPEDDGGVSKGVVAGASVGGVFALLIGIAAIWLVFKRKKKQKQMINSRDPSYHPAELERNGVGPVTSAYKPELDGRHLRAELTGDQTRTGRGAGLTSNAARAELEDRSPRRL